MVRSLSVLPKLGPKHPCLVGAVGCKSIRSPVGSQCIPFQDVGEADEPVRIVETRHDAASGVPGFLNIAPQSFAELVQVDCHFRDSYKLGYQVQLIAQNTSINNML